MAASVIESETREVKMLKYGLALAVFCLFLAGCTAPGGFPPQTMEETQKIPADKRIEISLAPGTFAVEEVEFHVDAGSLPAGVVEMAKAIVPGYPTS